MIKKKHFMGLLFIWLCTSSILAQVNQIPSPGHTNINKDVESYDTFGYLGKDYALGVIGGFKKRSEPIYNKYLLHANLPYGAGVRETFDHFHNPTFSESPKGIFIFIHGGYWQGEVKESYAFMAQKLLEQNIDVILIEYDLTKDNVKFSKELPRVTMEHIAHQIYSSLDAVQEHLQQTTFKESLGEIPVFLSGHSAGGHLAALSKDHPLINKAVMPISGIFDLVPVAKTKKIGKALELNELQAKDLSPMNKVSSKSDVNLDKDMVLFYGADEQIELVNQSKDYYEVLKQNNWPTQLIGVPHTDHFTVLIDLFENDQSPLLEYINQSIDSSN